VTHPTQNDRMERAAARVGTLLKGKYRVDRVLGAGGMAVVYAVTHRNQKQLAVKMLHAELSCRADLHARFLREGYVANSVKHPGSVAVLDDDTTDDGAAFLVMELLEGDSIEALWEEKGKTLPVRAVLALAHQLLDVLAAAHAHGIVHRDIKPANLFLTYEGKLKVLDFGVARLREPSGDSTDPTHTGMLLGTPAFMAPEQAMAKSSEVDAQSDLWAVGATLFTLISGELVHLGDNAQQLMVRAATAVARSLAEVAPAVPQPVVALVDRALAFEKADRWPDALTMRDAVRDASLSAYGEVLSSAPLLALLEGRSAARQQAVHADTLASQSRPKQATSSLRAPAVTPQAPGKLPSTAHPVSSDRRGRPSSRTERSRVVPALAVAGAIVAVGVGALVLRGSPHVEAPTPGASTSLAPVPVGTAPASTAASTASQAPSAAASVPASASTPPPAAAVVPARRVAPAHTASAPAAAPKATIDPGSVR